MDVGQIQDQTKSNLSLLWSLEQRWITWLTPKLPHFLNGHNLTLLSLAWSLLAVLFAYMAQFNIVWIWAMTTAILLQYITDCLDGAVGRYRNSGLARWGYVMDHFFDYIFLAALFIGYTFLVSDNFRLIPFALFIVSAGFMFYACLIYSVLREFPMSSFSVGPTESRIILIILNTVFFFFGVKALDWGLTATTIICFGLVLSAVFIGERKLYKYENSSRG